MRDRLEFGRVARVPAPGDNVAIATRRLESGTLVADGTGAFRLPHTVLEGHRFVRTPTPQGAQLTSWGLPFGIATRALEPGEYVCNERILNALGARDIDFALPGAANFVDTMETYSLDEACFVRRARRSRLPTTAPPSRASAAPAGGASAHATSSRWWPPRRAPTASCARSRSARRPRRPPGSTAWSRSPTPKAAVPVGPTTWVTCCACSRASWCTPTWAPCSRPTTARVPTPTTTCGASWRTAATRSTTCRTRSSVSRAGSRTRSRVRLR